MHDQPMSMAFVFETVFHSEMQGALSWQLDPYRWCNAPCDDRLAQGAVQARAVQTRGKYSTDMQKAGRHNLYG